MRVTIVQGLQQAYYNLVHMIAEFLPRFVVMVVIILVGLLGLIYSVTCSGQSCG